MTNSELFYTLALIRTEGVGDIFAKRLLAHFGTAQQIFEAKASDFSDISRIHKPIIAQIINKSSFSRSEKELAFIEKKQIKTFFFKDRDYPQRLTHCPDAPILLFATGNFNIDNQHIISIVGTRNITPYGKSFCEKLIADLSGYNPVIVSGFAMGVDICAHLVAIENNLTTLGILAHGFDRVYPAIHKKYYQKMTQQGGFMTEFWSESIPERENFVRRNRIVAGISDATIVIESDLKGGSLITANLANDYSREVFALPGRVNETFSRGCNELIKTQRANLLSDAEDIINLLNWKSKSSLNKPIQKELFVSLDPEQQKILDYLNSNGKDLLDTIAINCKIPVYKTASILFDLELKGLVKPLPGKVFESVG